MCIQQWFLYEMQTHFVFASVFRPISAKAKLRMNPRSDVDFSSPKVDLVVNLPEVAVELSRPQVCSSVNNSLTYFESNNGLNVSWLFVVF